MFDSPTDAPSARHQIEVSVKPLLRFLRS